MVELEDLIQGMQCIDIHTYLKFTWQRTNGKSRVDILFLGFLRKENNYQ